MSITKPYTFTAGTKARANEVNSNFDTLYSQVNSNISHIAQNASNIEDLDSTKAELNGSSSQRFAVADAVSNADAINKQTLENMTANSRPYINGLQITKDSNSPEDTIIVAEGSCYDSGYTTMMVLSASTSKQNTNQGASTTYYIHLIANDSGSSTDILISTSQIDPALPTGYTKYRNIGYYETDDSAEISFIDSKGGGTIFVTSSENGVGNRIVTESYVNGTSWYRIWSDGWKEQGGTTSEKVYNYVTFLKPFTSTPPTVLAIASGYTGNNHPYTNTLCIQAKSTTGITLMDLANYGGGGNNYGNMWYACGY